MVWHNGFQFKTNQKYPTLDFKNYEWIIIVCEILHNIVELR